MSYGMKCMIVVDTESGKVCGKAAEFSLDMPADKYNEDPKIREQSITVWYCREHWRQHQLMLQQAEPTVEWYMREE
jgi:hypothetical protein